MQHPVQRKVGHEHARNRPLLQGNESASVVVALGTMCATVVGCKLCNPRRSNLDDRYLPDSEKTK